jgi:hypothetical protein
LDGKCGFVKLAIWIPVEKDRIAFNKFIDDKIKENYGFDTYAKAVRLTLAQDSLKRDKKGCDSIWQQTQIYIKQRMQRMMSFTLSLQMYQRS